MPAVDPERIGKVHVITDEVLQSRFLHEDLRADLPAEGTRGQKLPGPERSGLPLSVMEGMSRQCPSRRRWR